MDRTQWVNSSGTTVGYPLYDGHGNMVATLAKSGSSFSLGDQRAYDAWGVIRQGATSGDPKGRYCANLGHVDDDESGLTYMRARYYEPGCGRFVSEDPARDAQNWFVYCNNNPINYKDFNGNLFLTDAQLAQLLEKMSVNLMFSREAKIVASVALLFMQTWLAFGQPSVMDFQSGRKKSWIATFQGEAATAQTIGLGSVKDKAKSLTETYAIMLLLTMWVTDPEEMNFLN